MKQKRILYAIIIAVTIATGLFIRMTSAWFPDMVNLYLGDILYAFMMFYIVTFVVPYRQTNERLLIALMICFAIEFLQMCQASWIITIRQTLPGRLVLGSGFLWSDLMAYAVGVISAYVFEKIMLSKGNITH